MLAKLKLDTDNVVLAMAWANPNQRKVGDKTEDGFTIYEVDETEYQAFVANHTKLIDGHLVVDSDYTPPADEPIEEIDPKPNPEQEAITQLAFGLSDNQKHIQSIEQAITELTLSQTQTGGSK